jgi:hypothetical protein
LVIDEFSEFTAQSEEALSRMLSLTRKYGLFLVMAHQTWSQASDRLRGALQNVGVETTFRLGREDAQRSAPMLGRVDPLSIKHEVVDSGALDRTHPVFYSLGEQWEEWVQAIQDLKPRQAFIRVPKGQVVQIKTMSVPDPKVDKQKLAQVEQHYLENCFRSLAGIQAELDSYRAASPPSPGVTRSRKLD